MSGPNAAKDKIIPLGPGDYQVCDTGTVVRNNGEQFHCFGLYSEYIHQAGCTRRNRCYRMFHDSVDAMSASLFAPISICPVILASTI